MLVELRASTADRVSEKYLRRVQPGGHSSLSSAIALERFAEERLGAATSGVDVELLAAECGVDEEDAGPALDEEEEG